MILDNEYFSYVRHELKNQLVVVREGVSQVLDGLGGRDCAKCSRLLAPALECADNLNRLIDELVSAFKFNTMIRQAAGAAASPSPVVCGKDELESLKKELLTMISHEIRTPLTVIKEGLSLILEEVPAKLEPGQKELLSRVKANTDRLVDVVEKMLFLSWDKIIKPPQMNPQMSNDQ